MYEVAGCFNFVFRVCVQFGKEEAEHRAHADGVIAVADLFGNRADAADGGRGSRNHHHASANARRSVAASLFARGEFGLGARRERRGGDRCDGADGEPRFDFRAPERKAVARNPPRGHMQVVPKCPLRTGLSTGVLFESRVAESGCRASHRGDVSAHRAEFAAGSPRGIGGPIRIGESAAI